MNYTKTKVGIIGTVGVPARYGGFETLAHQLVKKLNHKYGLTVYNSTKHYSAKERVPTWNGAKIKYIPLSANGVFSIPYDIISMIHAALFCEVLLILGVSGCLFLPIIKLFFPFRKIIVNVDGLEWRRAKWAKHAKFFLLWSEKVAIWCADEIIGDNAAIQKYVFDRYGKICRLIEYGADHNQTQILQPETLRTFPFLNNKYAFKVARIEPENHVHLILKAFAKQDTLPLVLVGNWKNSAYGRSLQDEFKAFPHLHLLDSIYESNLLNQIRSNAYVYVHGHGEGGTNPSLVEAMYLGLPILSYDVIYNKITTENQAVYFSSENELHTLIDNIENIDLGQMAHQLKAVANRRYKWSVIANKYSQLVSGTSQAEVPTFDFELPIKLQRAIA